MPQPAFSVRPGLVHLRQDVVHGIQHGAGHRAVDRRRRGLVRQGAGIGDDAPRRNGALAQRPQETLVPVAALVGLLDVGQGARDPAIGIVQRLVEDGTRPSRRDDISSPRYPWKLPGEGSRSRQCSAFLVLWPLSKLLPGAGMAPIHQKKRIFIGQHAGRCWRASCPDLTRIPRSIAALDVVPRDRRVGPI